MIPLEHNAAVTRALREAFGVTACDDIRGIAKSPAAPPVFRVVVRGTPFLLKIHTRRGDMARHMACMRAAADAGLAPLVRYASVEDRVFLTDYVEAVPFPAAQARALVAVTLQKLHALPPFPGVPHNINTTCLFLVNPGSALDGFLEKFQAANLLSPDETGQLLECRRQLAAVYPHDDGDMVSSHNDLFKPDNIMFDGVRVWLVDWEAAFLNDRYADLAVFANMVVNSEAEELAFLAAYFGAPPTPYQRARFFLARQLAHLFYALGFLMIASATGPVDCSEKIPEYEDFQRRFWSGEIALTDTRTKLLYAVVHRERLLRNISNTRFEESLRIVADRAATA
jgi:thiamine kinase-like enzyme